MKNKFRQILCSVGLAITLLGATAISVSKGVTSAYADEHIEEKYDSLYINDLSGFVGSGAVRNNQTNNIDQLSYGCRAGYNTAYKNIELKATVNFTAINWFEVKLRTAFDSKSDCTFTSQGYSFRLYSNGQYEYIKNGSSAGATFGPHAALTTGTDYDFTLKTVNCEDGSVHVSFVFDGLTFFDVYDTESPIVNAGIIGIVHDGCDFSIKGKGLNVNLLNPTDVAMPVTSDNFPATINADGSISTNSAGALGFSGGVYSLQTSTSEMGFKIKAKASAKEGRLVFQIGGINGGHAYNRPNIVGDWGWADTGYVYYWSVNGQRHFGRNASDTWPDLDYQWKDGYLANTEYEVEMSIKELTIGNRVLLKINGNIELNFIDLKTTSNTPLKLPKTGVPGSLVTTFAVYSVSVASTFKGDTASTYETKSVVKSHLGNPETKNGTTFSPNGEPTGLKSGVAVKYPNLVSNTSVQFKANFTSVSSIGFMLNYVGTLDQIFGGDWTTKGYAIILYSNGQIILAKGGTVLAEGWCTVGFSLVSNKDYLMEFGTYETADSMKVFFKIDNNLILNFIDVENPIKTSGVFAIQSIDTTGSISAEGVTFPSISADKTTLNVGESATLSYENPQVGDVVSYSIDSGASTATGSISGSSVTALSSGVLNVYGCINGIYSNEISITVNKEAAPVIWCDETNLVVGGENIQMQAKMSDNSPFSVKTYEVTPVTGDALITNDGVMTGLKAGTVIVNAYLDGKKSNDLLIYVKPKIHVKNTIAMVVGGIRTLEYEANCELPNESITATFSIVSGQEHVSFDPETNKLTGLSRGQFSLFVSVVGETFSGTSPIVTLAVEDPIVVITKQPRDMVIGQSQNIQYAYGYGEIPVQSAQIVVLDGNDLVDVDGMKITAKKAGNLRFKVVVNGVDSLDKEILIDDLRGQIVVSDMKSNSEQSLSVIFNDASYVPTKIVYSIISGQDVASISGNVITTANKNGNVTIQAVIDDKITLTQGISVYDKVLLTNLSDGEIIFLNETYQIGCAYNGLDEIKTVEYVVSDTSIATVTKDATNKGTLVAKNSGTFTIYVEINGEKSQPLTIIAKNPTYQSLLAIGGQRHFEDGEVFNHDGLVVVAIDEKGGQHNVTSQCRIKSPVDLGNHTARVDITFENQDGTLLTSYNITYEGKLRVMNTPLIIVIVALSVTAVGGGVVTFILLRRKYKKIKLGGGK